jgi:tRNA threonylcarbamoyladenosine biosynthesis protein TsaB
VITLALDASTYVGSVAVFEGERLVAEETAAMRGRESERLLPAVDAVLRSAGLSAAGVGRIVCGSGPGSFTSLRIAASIAKGMAAGLDVPLLAVSSLALVVAGNLDVAKGAGGSYLAVMNAMRGESYVAEFIVDGAVRAMSEIRIVPTRDVAALARAGGSTAVGPEQDGAWFPHARGSLRTSDQAGPVNLAGWEPRYGRLAEAQARWEATHGRALPP